MSNIAMAMCTCFPQCVPAIITDPTSSYLSYSNALTQEGVDRITGLNAIVSHLGTETFTVAGERHTVRVFDQASVVRNAAASCASVVAGAAISADVSARGSKAPRPTPRSYRRRGSRST